KLPLPSLYRSWTAEARHIDMSTPSHSRSSGTSTNSVSVAPVISCARSGWYSRFVYPFAEIDTDAFWKSAYTFLRHACIDSIQPREKTSSAVVTVVSGERAYIRSDGAHCITPSSSIHM